MSEVNGSRTDSKRRSSRDSESAHEIPGFLQAALRCAAFVNVFIAARFLQAYHTCASILDSRLELQKYTTQRLLTSDNPCFISSRAVDIFTDMCGYLHEDLSEFIMTLPVLHLGALCQGGGSKLRKYPSHLPETFGASLSIPGSCSNGYVDCLAECCFCAWLATTHTQECA